MANKDNRRGNRETRKPKQEKTKPTTTVSPFVVTTGRSGAPQPAKKR